VAEVEHRALPAVALAVRAAPGVVVQARIVAIRRQLGDRVAAADQELEELVKVATARELAAGANDGDGEGWVPHEVWKTPERNVQRDGFTPRTML
jgi:hypothetical protein